MRRIASLLLSLSLLAGCAYGRAIDRGHDLVAQSRWRDALVEFDRARKLDPDEQEAQRLYERSIPYAIAEAKEEAGEAVAAGRYEDAMKLAAYVAELDPDEGKEVRQAVAGWMRAAIEGFIIEKKFDTAYELALRAKAQVGAWPPLDEQLVIIRDHYLKTSDAAFATGEYRRALEALEVIEAREPERAPLHADRRGRIEAAWADEVAGRAASMVDAGHSGAAAALYARAFEIARRPADRDAMTAQLAQLKEHGLFSVNLDVHGGATRGGIAGDAGVRLRGVQGVHLARSGEAVSMLARVDAGPIRCVNETAVSTEGVRYQSGTRLVDNPAFVALTRTIEARSREVDDHARAEVKAQAQVSQLASRAGRCSDELGSLERTSRAAERAADEAQQAVDAQQRKVDALRDRLRAAPPDRKERIQRRLERAEEELRALQKVAQTAATERDRARADFEAAERRCRSITDTYDRAIAEVNRHRAEREAAERALENARRERGAVPAQIEEPVYDTFRYDVREVTRTCTGPLAIELKPAWRAEQREVFDHAHHTVDQTHEAYPKYGVAADPLQLPQSDAQLADAIDASAAEAVVQLVASLAQDYYASMLDRAASVAAESPHLATDMMLALWVAAPEHITAADRRRVAKHLATHYEVENLEQITH